MRREDAHGRTGRARGLYRAYLVTPAADDAAEGILDCARGRVDICLEGRAVVVGGHGGDVLDLLCNSCVSGSAVWSRYGSVLLFGYFQSSMLLMMCEYQFMKLARGMWSFIYYQSQN